MCPAVHDYLVLPICQIFKTTSHSKYKYVDCVKKFSKNWRFCNQSINKIRDQFIKFGKTNQILNMILFI